MRTDVTVVGAGPAGCAVAREIARQGYLVTVLEEHDQAGEPVHCAGLISPRALKLAGVPGTVVLNRINGARVFSPADGYFHLAGRKVQALVIDRGAFDRNLAAQAERAGALLQYSTRAVGFERAGDGLTVRFSRKGREGQIQTRLLVGADGVHSAVAAWMGREPPAQMVRIFAAEAELPCAPLSMGLVRVFVGPSVAPGWFGWMIPVSRNRVRVGVGVARAGGVNTREVFARLCAAFPEHFTGLRLEQLTGGTVPLGLVRRSYDDRVMLVGDAACQTKPLTGGGIYLGLAAADACARVAIRALKNRDCSASFLKSYQEAWHRKMAEEIRFGLEQRALFRRLNDAQISSALCFFNRPFWHGFALRFGDFDHHSWLGRKVWSLPSWLNQWRSGGSNTNY